MNREEAELVTPGEMRALEAAAIASGAVTGAALMERAGRAVLEAALARFPALAGGVRRGAAVLCGPGNNGGDGYVVARLLAARGWEVTAWALGDPARLRGDAAAAFAAWDGPVRPLAEAAEGLPAETALVVDALFGIGLSRPLDAALADLLRAIARRAARAVTVAVDIESGRFAGSGGGGGALPPDLTVTFHRAKPGHWLQGGPGPEGALAVVPLEPLAPPATGPGGHPRLALAAPPSAALLAKTAPHKYACGHVLVAAGGRGQGGAARLAARAALRSGAGLVTLGPPPSALTENAAQLTAVMLRPVPNAEAFAALLADPRINAVCLGPGAGVARARALAAALPRAAAPRLRAVLDADALTAHAGARGTAALARLAGALDVLALTPHEGEFARLFPDLSDAMKDGGAGRHEVAAQAAARSGALLVLKGVDTAIAAPGGTVRLHCATGRGALPWLATAGAGDVLAGLAAGLLARLADPVEALEAAVGLHAAAARAAGPGLIAEDLPEALPAVLAGLGA